MSDKVNIELCVIGDDDAFRFERPAPRLPCGLTWHANMMIEIVENDEWAHVDHVCLNLDGSVTVEVHFKMPGSGWGEMAESSWWESRGWVLVKKQ